MFSVEGGGALNARCVATTVVILVLSLGGHLSAQNKAIDAEHETKLGRLAQLNNTGRFLFADGIWRADKPTEKEVNSVTHLECYKSGGREIVLSDAYCMEATAMITFGDIPSVNVSYYSVVSWDADRVIASDSPTSAFPICIWTQITINLHDQSIMATDTRKLAKGHEGLDNVCEKLPLAQTYHLLDTAGELTRKSMEKSHSSKTKK